MTNNVTRLPTPPPPGGGIPEPRDDDAERQVLGAMLQSPRAIDAVIPLINGTDFRLPAHELIFDAAAELHLTGQPVDPITVADHLAADLGRAGGQAHLHELYQGVITAANADYHAAIVAERSAERRTQRTALQLISRIQAGDGTPIAQLIEQAREALARVPSGTTDDTSTWEPVDLGALLDADEIDLGPTPQVMTRTDGKPLLYPGAIHSISGEPGSGKTWAAIIAVDQEIRAGHHVLYLDFEDRAATLIGRLRSLGTPENAIRAHVRYIRPETALNPTARTALDKAATGCTLAVIDGITEAMTLHGLSLMDNEDVARWLALIPHHIANLGPATLQIDHVVKNAEARGRYAIGGQHKLAGITGVAFKMLTVKSFGRGNDGHAKLVIDKDRHGHVGPAGTTVAELHLDARTEKVVGWLETPQETTTSDATGEMRPTVLMEKVSVFLEHVADATGSQIEKAVRGKTDYVRLAVRTLIAEGYVATSSGPHGSTLHRSLEPYNEGSDHAI